MKRIVFYKTKWSRKREPFLCQLADKAHYPEVKAWVETPARFPAIPYKEIDDLMYQTRKGDGFETLAVKTAKKIADKIEGDPQRKRKKGEIRVTVRVKEDKGFWVDAVEKRNVK